MLSALFKIETRLRWESCLQLCLPKAWHCGTKLHHYVTPLGISQKSGTCALKSGEKKSATLDRPLISALHRVYLDIAKPVRRSSSKWNLPGHWTERLPARSMGVPWSVFMLKMLWLAESFLGVSCGITNFIRTWVSLLLQTLQWPGVDFCFFLHTDVVNAGAQPRTQDPKSNQASKGSVNKVAHVGRIDGCGQRRTRSVGVRLDRLLEEI